VKYKFVNKAKSLTPNDIKAQMNFDNVVKGASIWAGFKLGSALLKIGSKATASIVAGTSTVVVTTAIVVGTTTDIFKGNDNSEAQLVPTEILIDDEPVEDNNIVILDSVISTPKPTKVVAKPKKVAKTEPQKKVLKPIAQNSVAKTKIVYANVQTNAAPLPDINTFKRFIDNELAYPVDQIATGEDTVESIEGYVDVFWTVNEKGEATNFKIRKSLGEAFDNEAIRVIKKYQNWSAATFNGDAVDSNLSFIIHFRTK